MNGKDLINKRGNRKKKGVYITVFIFLIVIVTTTLSIAPSGMTVYVAGNGKGNFNCNGTDDQIELNQALAYVAENPEFTTVHLKGPNTYVISDSVFIGNDTILEGDPTAVIKLKDKAGWPVVKPLITHMNSAGTSNITIKGFEMDGNHDGNAEKKKGTGYYNLIHFVNSTNIQVHDMYMHDSHGDGLKVENSSNIQFYDNIVYKLGHDGLYGIQSQYLEAWNNTITCRTNSGLRVWDSNHVKFHDNTIDSFYHWSAGGPGIQIQKSAAVMDDIEVYNNTIHNTYGPGIWLLGYGNYPLKEAQNVHIHHNTFYSTGTNPSIDWVGGIVTSGFNNTLIENNVFDRTYHAAIVLMYPTDRSIDIAPKGMGYTTIVRNNIITNAKRRKSESSGTGFGVVNYLPETHSFVLENNCFYNNVAGNYKNAASTSDIYANPLFANKKENDYHLRSSGGRWNGKTWVKDIRSSPCIDAGYSSSDYSNEPENNGKIINIGRYGNTEEASKSGVMPGYVAWWNQIFSPEWRIFRILLRAFILLCFKIKI